MRTLAISSAIVLALLLPLSSMTSHAQQADPTWRRGWHGGMMMGGPTGPGGWYCPWMGGYGGYHHWRGGPSSAEKQQPLTKARAEQMLMDYYIQNNPNLKIGALADKGDYYDATIVTKKEGALVEKVQVDKKTGWFRKMR